MAGCEFGLSSLFLGVVRFVFNDSIVLLVAFGEAFFGLGFFVLVDGLRLLPRLVFK